MFRMRERQVFLQGGPGRLGHRQHFHLRLGVPLNVQVGFHNSNNTDAEVPDRPFPWRREQREKGKFCVVST